MACNGGTCSPTGSNANLNVKDLRRMLARSDVSIVSTSVNPDIGVLAALMWTNGRRLTLDAVESIHIRAPIVVEGPGGLTLVTNDGGVGGDYTFNPATAGAITFWDTDSSLVINGKSFTLVKRLPHLVAQIALNPSGNYALVNDYDSSVDGTYTDTPIRGVFTGTFEGLGHTITKLQIQGGAQGAFAAGLFAQSNGTLRDIALTGLTIRMPNAGSAGALVVANQGTVAHAFASGLIEVDGDEAGGLVYSNAGLITQSSADVTVIGTQAGGLVDDNDATGTITWSHAGGSVSATQAGGYAGGLVQANSGAIADCYATGPVAGTTAGGLVGLTTGPIVQSFASGAVGNGVIGGLVGIVLGGGTVSQSYATGTVAEGGNVSSIAMGGLVGVNQVGDGVRNIVESYSTGAVEDHEVQYVGGFVGDDQQGHHARNGYWDFDTSGITDPGQGAGRPRGDRGITGLTDVQLKAGLPAGFDPAIWGQDPAINGGWPYLLANPPQ
jgi:hypothetical protein